MQSTTTTVQSMLQHLRAPQPCQRVTWWSQLSDKDKADSVDRVHYQSFGSQTLYAYQGAVEEYWRAEIKGAVTEFTDINYNKIFGRRDWTGRLTCWMLGATPSTAIPVVRLQCDWKKCFQRLAKLLSTERWWLSTGFKLVCSRGTDTAWTVSDHDDVVLDSHVSEAPSFPEECHLDIVGASIFTYSSLDGEVATGSPNPQYRGARLACALNVDAEVRLLTVCHFFRKQIPDPNPDHDWEDEEILFDDFSDSDGDDSALFSETTSLDGSIPEMMIPTKTNEETLAENRLAEQALVCGLFQHRSEQFIQPLGSFVAVDGEYSEDLDWALFRPLPGHSANGLDKLPAAAHEAPQRGAMLRELKSGSSMADQAAFEFTGRTALISPPGSKTLCSVYILHKQVSSIQYGSSGTLLCDDSVVYAVLIGQSVASPEEHYAIPVSDILADIRSKIGREEVSIASREFLNYQTGPKLGDFSPEDADLVRRLSSSIPSIPTAVFGPPSDVCRYLDDLDPDYKVQRATECLGIAVVNRRSSLVEMLLNYDVNLNLPVAAGDTPLIHAVRSSQIGVVEILLKAGAAVQDVSREGTNAITIAVEKESLGLVSMILKAGGNPFAVNSSGLSALCASMSSGNLRIFDLILQHTHEQDVQGQGYDQAIIHAAGQPSVTFLTSLLQRRHEMSYVGNSSTDHEAFINAAKRGLFSHVQVLLAAGSLSDYVDCYDSEGFNALGRAAAENELAIGRCLIEAGADVNLHQPGPNMMPLQLAARRGHAEMITLLLACDADANIHPVDSLPPLSLAVTSGKMECLLALIRGGVSLGYDIDAAASPLLLAVQGRHSAVSSLLIACNARDRKTWRRLLKQRDFDSIRYLGSLGGNVDDLLLAASDSVDDSSDWLHQRTCGLFSGRMDHQGSVLRADLTRGSGFIPLSHGEKALMAAVLDADEMSVAILLGESRATAEFWNDQGRTALMIACERGCQGIARRLINFAYLPQWTSPGGHPLIDLNTRVNATSQELIDRYRLTRRQSRSVRQTIDEDESFASPQVSIHYNAEGQMTVVVEDGRASSSLSARYSAPSMISSSRESAGSVFSGEGSVVSYSTAASSRSLHSDGMSSRHQRVVFRRGEDLRLSEESPRRAARQQKDGKEEEVPKTTIRKGRKEYVFVSDDEK